MNKRLFIKRSSIILLSILLQVGYFPVVALAQEESLSLEEQSSEHVLPVDTGIDPNIILAENSQDASAPAITPSETYESSASIRRPIQFRDLDKRSYRADEDVTVYAYNAEDAEIHATLKDKYGREFEAHIQKMVRGDTTIVRVLPSDEVRPGKYTLTITDENGVEVEQDFTWGVLALNTNKSVYTPSEKVEFSMAVLDDWGEMVCNADVELRVTSYELHVDETLSTEDGTIQVNPVCNSKEFTLTPDFSAEYLASESGVYELTLTAETENGSRSITDQFEVLESVSFDVTRMSATRIYPLHTYPVQLTIYANEDFSGEVLEAVPSDFVISEAKEGTPYDSVELVSKNQAEKESVLGARTTLNMPFEGNAEVVSEFGDTDIDPKLQKKYEQYGVAGHDGIDFDIPSGTEVLSVDSGTVVIAKENWDYGTSIVINHEWGKSYYGHLSSLFVKEGQKVEKGDVIGLSGSTGLSTGPHLHFGVKPHRNVTENGYFGKVDPRSFLGLDGSKAVLGASSTDDSVQMITWNVDLKKGDEITLSYEYDAPNASPEFYTVGPALFLDLGGNNVFEEKREWQIAVDATESRWASSHITGSFANPTNAVGSTNNTWAGVLNQNSSYTSRWAMEDPSGSITGTQTIRVFARKGSNSNIPTIALNLYENGSLIQSLVGATNVTSTTGQTVQGTFDATAITNPNNVEIEVVESGTGGSGSARNSAQIDSIEWVVNLLDTVTVGTTGTQATNLTIGQTNQHVGGAFTMISSSGTVTVTGITVSETGSVNANTNLTNALIRYETAGTCTYDGNETIFASGVSFNGSDAATFSGSANVSTSQVCFYVVFDVGSGATAGQEIEIQITNPSTQVTVGSGAVTPSSPVAIAGTTTLVAAASGPELYQLMRHGKWFNTSGVRQPFTF